MKVTSTARTREAGIVCEPNRSPRSWRRFLRFGVRGLMLFVVVFGAGLGWIVRQAHIQRDAVAAIERDDGVVYYDSGWTDGPTNVTVIAPIVREPWAPKWRDY